MVDAIVIGSGPNGLVAAHVLARAGWSVLVLEAAAEPGGAVRSGELTLPGFVHDLGAAFFPFGPVSPALEPLDLEGAGVTWCHAPFDSAHPAVDGTCSAIGRDVQESVSALGSDGPAWRSLAEWFGEARSRVLPALLATLPALREAVRLRPRDLAWLARAGLFSGRTFSAQLFETEAARRIVPALSLHTDVGPEDAGGAAVGFVLAALASSSGFGVPRGGAGAISRALVQRVGEAGGTIQTSSRVARIVIREARAAAVVTQDGTEIAARRAVIADVAAPRLFRELLDPMLVPTPVTEAMRTFRQGFGTFKVDWALDGPVPWLAEAATRAAVVHTGDSVDDMARFTRQVRAGEIPDAPYLVIGQQSLADPTRAPAGRHTLWAYSRVPSRIPGGWNEQRERFADRIDARIESLAPGFRARVLARAIATPDDLESMNANLVGGDITGGTAALSNQLFLRPVFPYFRYAMPTRGLYLASSYAHPGAGVHGACGRNAALAALHSKG